MPTKAKYDSLTADDKYAYVTRTVKKIALLEDEVELLKLKYLPADHSEVGVDEKEARIERLKADFKNLLA